MFPILILHISAGVIGLLAGAAAMFLRKGSRWHRKSGNVFFVSLLIVAVSAMFLAVLIKNEFPDVPILVFYMVATSWATIKRPEGKIGRFEIGAFVVVSVFAAAMLIQGFDPANGEAGTNQSGLYFFFGGVAALAAILDLNMIVRGGLVGAHRIARHLWRMCLAFTGALASFLSQEKFIPDVLWQSGYLWVPLLLMLILMVYWLVRVLVTKYFSHGITISDRAVFQDCENRVVKESV
ncbi:MAG: DUF2306 domain-containing protein [Algicola sp.]|nr:DUF2306 domain-containing protein [Algicola sp.]